MQQHIEEKIKGKTILITGGTGSFGNSVVGKLLECNPKKIIILSRDEKKQHDMRNKYNNQLLKFVIGDVRDKSSLEWIFEGVDYVFHAAALKQVPTCEFFPLEAVKTNILGAQNVLTVAANHGVERVVILSTDKAVYPINAMGMTKALMEKIMFATAKSFMYAEHHKTVFCGVRYGNVLYSRGSVLPYFVEQIKKNQKLSITNGKMTRFLLPLTSAVDLVLYALIHGATGSMYVRKSPACTVEVLAQAVCEIFKYDKGYEEVGIRAGEKMHETLLSKEELVRAEDLSEYYRVPSESQGLDYNKYLSRGDKLDVEKVEPYTSANTQQLSVQETVDLLLTLPEIQDELKNFS